MELEYFNSDQGINFMELLLNNGYTHLFEGADIKSLKLDMLRVPPHNISSNISLHCYFEIDEENKTFVHFIKHKDI